MPPIELHNSTPTAPLERAQRGRERALGQLGAARRIRGAADDAAGLARSENLRAAERSLQQGARNLSDGVSALRTAEGGLAQSSELLGRLRELSIRAQNSGISEAGQSAIQGEFDQLSAELTRIADATTFGGRRLLSGETSGENALQIEDGSAGSSGAVSVSLADMSSSGLAVAGLQAREGATLDALERALGSIASTRAQIGAAETRVRTGIENLRSAAQSGEAARSRIQDTDVAAAAAADTREQILQRAGTAAQAQANLSAGLALSLLR